MKKLLSILSLCILVVSQYALQYNYLECIAANNFSTTAVKCDCESLGKKLEAAKTGLPSENKQHQHLHVDEWYNDNFTNPELVQAFMEIKKYTAFYLPDNIRSAVKEIDHPPSS